MGDKPGLDAEGLDGSQTCLANLLGDFLNQVVDGVTVVVDDVHQRQGSDVAGFEQHVALGVDDAVEGLNVTVDELFHDVDVVVLGIDEPLNILIGTQLVGVVGMKWTKAEKNHLLLCEFETQLAWSSVRSTSL